MTDLNAGEKIALPWKWVEGRQARRPLLPSEMRTAATRTRRLLPAARADMGSSRPMLPWQNRAGNDWRGVTRP